MVRPINKVPGLLKFDHLPLRNNVQHQQQLACLSWREQKAARPVTVRTYPNTFCFAAAAAVARAYVGWLGLVSGLAWTKHE